MARDITPYNLQFYLCTFGSLKHLDFNSLSLSFRYLLFTLSLCSIFVCRNFK